jgi:hypothetical protein
MSRIIFYISIAALFYSCGTGLRIKRSEIKPIDNTFSGKFINTSYKSKGGNYYPTLSKRFGFSMYKIDTISMKLVNINTLQISFNDSLTTRTITYNGKISQRGYFEIYFRKYKKEIPPFIPFSYSSLDIERVRIGLSVENDLIIDNKWERSGNILILGSGGRGRTQNYFKRIM